MHSSVQQFIFSQSLVSKAWSVNVFWARNFRVNILGPITYYITTVISTLYHANHCIFTKWYYFIIWKSVNGLLRNLKHVLQLLARLQQKINDAFHQYMKIKYACACALLFYQISQFINFPRSPTVWSKPTALFCKLYKHISKDKSKKFIFLQKWRLQNWLIANYVTQVSIRN